MFVIIVASKVKVYGGNGDNAPSFLTSPTRWQRVVKLSPELLNAEEEPMVSGR